MLQSYPKDQIDLIIKLLNRSTKEELPRDVSLQVLLTIDREAASKKTDKRKGHTTAVFQEQAQAASKRRDTLLISAQWREMRDGREKDLACRMPHETKKVWPSRARPSQLSMAMQENRFTYLI